MTARDLMLVTHLFVASALSGVSAAQDLPVLDADARARVVGRIGELMQANYVFPDKAEECSARLQERLGDGSLDMWTDPRDMADVLTRLLQEVTDDGHLRVSVRPPGHIEKEQEDPESAARRRLAQDRQRNYGFEQVLRLDDNVGMLDLRGFSHTEHDLPDTPTGPGQLAAAEAGRTAMGAMNYLANSDAIIVDLRQNGGGSPEMVQLICSYFFDEKTHLNSLYWRKGDQTDEFWTLDEDALPGPRLPDVPLVLLTSRNTFSAAEEFAYNLQTRGRCTIVGETTGGGAHPGDRYHIDGPFEMFISEGRAINPVTGTNWEGTGVVPDVATDADAAMAEGLSLARKKAREYRDQRASS